MTDRPQPLLHRRTIAGIATIGVGLPVLAACSGSDGSDVATDPNTPSPSSTPTASGSTEASPSESAGGADAFAQTSDIEVGGGTIFPEDQVVITQPSDGEFKCFSAVCTHQGCIVSSVSDGTHQLRVPRQRLLDRRRLGRHRTGHRAARPSSRSPSTGDAITLA